MNEKETMVDWPFGLWWTLTCALGVAFCGLVVLSTIWPLVEAVENLFDETAAVLVFGAAFGAALGLGAGIGPGLLLQSRGINSTTWISGSAIAGAVSGGPAMTILINSFDSGANADSITSLLVGLIIGLAVGIGQWLALRQAGPSARFWPLISAAAFAAAFGVGVFFGSEGRELLLLTAIGLLIGVISGLGMVWLQGRQSTVKQQPLM